MKLLSRDARELAHLLNPPLPPTSKADQQHVALLQGHGFQVIWDTSRAEQMHRLGAVLAKTHCDGALWPYARAKWSQDGLARWALKEDVAFFEELVKVLNGDQRPDSQEVIEKIDMIVRALGRQHAELTHDNLASLEAVVRLGTTAQVISYLESM